MSLGSLLPRTWKLALKAYLKQMRLWFAQTFQSYDRRQLLDALREVGVRPGDSVMLHSAFSRENGFAGSIGSLIDTFIEAVGPDGHLLMVSLPYRNASLDWLLSGRCLDVRKTPSMMGMVSEVFRRRDDVRRSVHPTHPILVYGPDAERFIAAHADCVYPCGPGTPFEALTSADGRVVFFDVPMDTFTYFHYLEHLVHSTLPFPLYTDELFDAQVIDAEGNQRTVKTYAFAREAIRRRRPERLYEELRATGKVASRRLGATQLLSLRVRDAIECTRALQLKGNLFYDMTP